MGKKDEDGFWQSVGPYLSLGWQMAITILLGLFLGEYLDGRFKSKPIWTAACALIFSGIALYNFIRSAIKNGNEKDDGSK